jgi:hypothetical protein
MKCTSYLYDIKIKVMTPLDKLVKYIRKRYETNESFENLITSLREEESGVLEFEKEESYKRGHEDGWQEGWNSASEVNHDY